MRCRGEAVPYHGRVLSAICCPDKFRGSLTAAEAAAEMAAGLRASGIAATELPLADGGEGTLDVLLADGRRLTTRVDRPARRSRRRRLGPAGRRHRRDRDGARQRARAGRAQRPAARRHARRRRVAARRGRAHGATRAIVTLGGSATTDGGLGALEALGWSLPFEVVVRLRRRHAASSTPRGSSARRKAPARADIVALDGAPARAAARYGLPRSAGRRRRRRARRRSRRARRHAALRLRRRRRSGRAARAARRRRSRRHRRGQARRVEPQRQGRRRRACECRPRRSP